MIKTQRKTIQTNHDDDIDVKRIIALRREKHITMHKMAKAVNCSYAEYSSYEHGRKPFPKEIYQKCMDYLNQYKKGRGGMKFRWNMTEDEWKRMMNEYKNHKENSDNVYGKCFIGGVCCNFVNTMDISNWYLYTNLFFVKENSGYGRLEDGTEYDLYNFGSPCVPTECASFEEFKQTFEAAFAAFIKKHKELKSLVNKKTNW